MILSPIIRIPIQIIWTPTIRIAFIRMVNYPNKTLIIQMMTIDKNFNYPNSDYPNNVYPNKGSNFSNDDDW